MNLIALSGEYQSGKDTAATRLEKLWAGDVIRHAFARKLKLSAAAALGITVDELEVMKLNPSLKIIVTRPGAYEMGGPTGQDVGYRLKHLTGREYLQWYGTEAHRNVFGDNFWVDQVMNDLSPAPHVLNVITDCRFPNEAEAVRAVGGHIWKIVGADEGVGEHKHHASEAGLPAHLIHQRIDNSVRGDNFSALDRALADALTEFQKVMLV